MGRDSARQRLLVDARLLTRSPTWTCTRAAQLARLRHQRRDGHATFHSGGRRRPRDEQLELERVAQVAKRREPLSGSLQRSPQREWRGGGCPAGKTTAERAHRAGGRGG